MKTLNKIELSSLSLCVHVRLSNLSAPTPCDKKIIRSTPILYTIRVDFIILKNYMGGGAPMNLRVKM